MKKLQWNMKEVFFFPTDVGVPKDVRTVKVKAGFTEKRSDDAVRLSGIYHIAAKVDFTEGERIEQIPRDVVYIDDVEMDGQSGYFEYAVPLYIDLPPEVEHPLRIEATDVKGSFDGQGSFTVDWNVNCVYGQASASEQASKEAADSERADLETASNESVAKEQENKEKPTAVKETSSKEEATVANNPENKEVATVVNEPVSKDKAKATPETSKEAVVSNEKTDTATAIEVQKEPVKAVKEEKTEIAQVTERQQTAQAPKQTVKAPVQESTATATQDSSSWNAQDDILSYIAALPDEWSSTRFRSNDIFVKSES